MDTNDKMTVLVVDDTPDNIQILSGVLSNEYKVKAAISGEKALAIASVDPKPDIILLDIMMPEMDGFEVCRRLKLNPLTQGIPVIFVTAKTETVDEEEGFEIGAVDYITKPISPSIVQARVRSQLAIYSQTKQLEHIVQKRTEQLSQNQFEIVKCLGRAAEYKDNETGMHVVRMSHYSRLLAQKVGADEEWCQLLYQAAPMHDIGKIGIPDAVLCKPGKLDQDEWLEMQRHVEYGYDILGTFSSPLLDLAKEIALYHHEKWDGNGYPNNVSGENIPLSGRIVAIADVFDALTSERPYKKAWTPQEAFDVIQKDAGTHFDPQLVDVFLTLEPELLEIKNTFGESES